MNPPILKRIANRRVNADLAAEGETPAPPLSLDVEIVSNACEGVLLQYRATDGSFHRSLYHRSVVEAERAARAEFGIGHDEWQAGDLPSAPARPANDRPPLPRRS
ncbi:MAG: hypothetical protein HOP19_21235 [Acidobacteria bacterium]|nr:hypothetical protein [Acidobacteriota bacterium]